MASNSPNTRENTYMSDTESGAEMARLLDQDRTLTTCMGGLWPERPDFAGVRDVLDVACGPGGWAQEVAFAQPGIQITGIDISQAMIEYANMQARVQHLDNAHFEVMDVTKPLDFPNGSFDLVNARILAGFMLKQNWEPLLAECYRILRPGGVLRLTETDKWGITNSPAAEQLLDLANKAAWRTGHSFDPSGHTLGITPMMERLLVRTGLQGLDRRAHAINFSSGAPAHQAIYNNFRVFLKLVQPFLLHTRRAFPEEGIPDQEELDRLYNQMLFEMLEDDFAGIFYMLTVWGVKPEAASAAG